MDKPNDLVMDLGQPYHDLQVVLLLVAAGQLFQQPLRALVRAAAAVRLLLPPSRSNVRLKFIHVDRRDFPQISPKYSRFLMMPNQYSRSIIKIIPKFERHLVCGMG